MNKWFEPKLKQEVSKGILNVMNFMLENRNEFLSYTQEDFMRDASLKLQLEEKIKRNEENARQIEHLCQTLSKKITQKITRLSSVKCINILNYHMLKKKIDLKFFQSKQEKSMRFIHMQKSRLEFLTHLQQSKLNDVEYMKQLLEDLLTENNSLLFQAFNLVGGGQTMQPPSISNAGGLNFTRNLLSSTIISYPQNTRPALNLSSIDPLFFSDNTNDNSASILNHSEFINLINQLLINSLSKLNSTQMSGGDSVDSLLNDLTTAMSISVNFSDNLDFYFDLSEKIEKHYTNTTSSLYLIQQVNRFYNLIKKSIDYLYEKEENGGGEFKASINSSSSSSSPSLIGYNFNKIVNIQYPNGMKCLIDDLNAQIQDLQSGFFGRVLQKLQNYKSNLSSNEFQQLRRDLFVAFYTNPSQLESYIEQINSFY
jgi:hypothetical protein